MKRIVILSMFCLTIVASRAENMIQVNDTVFNRIPVSEHQMLMPLKPTYHKNVTEAANWGRNWFIEVKGGASAFLGSPLGCGDVADRLKPTLQVGVGKWFTPAIGGRVVYQGLEYKNCDFQTVDYQNVHADFLYNVTSGFNRDANGLAKWDVIPYVGCGLIRSDAPGTKVFGMNYGAMGRYRATDRWHLTAELAGMTTFRNFDGIGERNRLGDNMLSLSLGFSVTIGKAGWKQVIDADPYISQNEWLRNYALKLRQDNQSLSMRHESDLQTIGEMKKILSIEGLLEKYHGFFDDYAESKSKRKTTPKNDYSGLNSLRARLNSKNWDGTGWEELPFPTDSVDQTETADWNEYLLKVSQGKTAIGAPVYFFFHIGTCDLIDNSQLVNLDEIARVARKYGLYVHVEGAADKATGTEEINRGLSADRARFIARELVKRKVGKDHVRVFSLGGVKEGVPDAASRRTKILLYYKR